MQRTRLLSSLFWLVFTSLLWWLLAGGGGWYIGIPAVVLATWLTQRLQLGYGRLHLVRLPGFLWLFTGQLLSGGWDVARRTFTPRLPIDPTWVRYELTSTDERVRLLLPALVGLLPGSLSTGVSDDHMVLHILDSGMPWQETVSSMERALDRLLAEPSL